MGAFRYVVGPEEIILMPKKSTPEEEQAHLRAVADELQNFLMTFVAAGFTREEAFELTRILYSSWRGEEG
jgi:hypothetical protein